MKEGFDVGSGDVGRARRAELHARHHGQRRTHRPARPSRKALADAPFDWMKTITSMLTIKGIYGREMYETWYAMSVLVNAGLGISPVITHRFPYHKFEEAFDTAESGKCGKVLLDWSEA